MKPLPVRPPSGARSKETLVRLAPHIGLMASTGERTQGKNKLKKGKKAATA